MKFFVAGLLLVNLIFAIWYISKSPDEEPVSSVDPGVEKLVMVNESLAKPAQSETQADNKKEAVDTVVDSPVKPPVDRQPAVIEKPPVRSTNAQNNIVTRKTSRGENCYVMSLFDSRQSAQVASDELQQQGYEVRLATRYSSKVTYLVYLPAYESAAEARRITRELEEKGQVDFQILAIKGKRNSISLGIYSQPHTAAIRQQQIEALGYSPLVEPVYGTPMGYQLEFNKRDISRVTPTERRRLTDTFKNLTILPQKCTS